MTTCLRVTIPAQNIYQYPIMIKSGLVVNWESWLPEYAPSRKIIIISDNQVAALYARKFCNELSQNGYQVELLEFPHGEQAKSSSTKLMLEEKMFAFGCDRHTLCVAFGGGVVGDLAGFTAATYMRGINYIQIPTSLLAMIDSSVGGKTAVNTSYGKNIIGAFWQPQAVIMDTALLASLPYEHIVNGLFEAVKIFATLDKSNFEYCTTHLADILALSELHIEHVISKAVALKAHVVEIDEHEKNLRMILNFGHTIAHAIEKISNYSVLHGYAVGLGMLVEAKISELAGMLSAADYVILADLLMRMGIKPTMLVDYDIESIIHAMRGDKKNINQQIGLVLLTGVGSVKNMDNQVSFPVNEDLIKAALTLLKNIEK